MKKRITAGLMTAAMALSMMTPVSVFAEENPEIVGKGSMMTTAACTGIYFDSSDFSYLYIDWQYTLYSNNDLVITADTYQTPFDNEQTEMASPLMNGLSYGLSYGEDSGLLLGAIGYNGTTDIEVKSIGENITLCDYKNLYGTNPETSVEFMSEASCWENKYEIRYSGSQFPETASNAGKEKYSGEHLMEMTIHNWTADEFVLAGHLIAAKETTVETEGIVGQYADGFDYYADEGLTDYIGWYDSDTYVPEEVGRPDLNKVWITEHIAEEYGTVTKPFKHLFVADNEKEYEKVVTDENGDKRKLDVYTWSSPQYIYQAFPLSDVMHFLEENDKAVLASWDKKGDFSCDGVLYKNAVSYHYELCLWQNNNVVIVTAELADNLILPENESGTYLLDFGEVCRDSSTEREYEISPFCLGLERESDSIIVGNHTVLNGKYIDNPAYPAPSQAELDFAEKQNQSLSCLSISARYSSPEIQKENEGLFCCVIDPSTQMFSTPVEFNKQYGIEPDAPFRFTAFGTTYVLTYHNGKISVNPSNLESGFQDEDFAEVDTFSAPEYTSVAETLPVAKLKPTMQGDADESGRVDILDVIAVNKAILGKEILSDQGFANADVSGNNKPDSVDSLMIMKKIVGLIQNFD